MIVVVKAHPGASWSSNQPSTYSIYLRLPHTPKQTQQTKLNTNCTKLYTLNKNMMKLNAQLVKENTMKL